MQQVRIIHSEWEFHLAKVIKRRLAHSTSGWQNMKLQHVKERMKNAKTVQDVALRIGANSFDLERMQSGAKPHEIYNSK